MTVEQFAQMQKPQNTENYELVEGELIPLPSGTLRHAEIRDMIGHLLWSYFIRNQIGKAYAEVDCRLGEDTVRLPDLAIFLQGSLKLVDLDKIPAPIAPDIAVKVLSPSRAQWKCGTRFAITCAAGAKRYGFWITRNIEAVLHKAAASASCWRPMYWSPSAAGFRCKSVRACWKLLKTMHFLDTTS